MKKLLTLLFLTLFSYGIVSAQEITGKWYGKTDLGAVSLRIILNIERDGENYKGTMQSPDQSEQLIPLSSVEFKDEVLTARVAAIGFTYTGKLTPNGLLEGSFTQNGNSFKLDLSRQEEVRHRPQEPKPKYPYQIEEVVFRNENAGINLSGTLTIPDRQGSFPAVLLVTGSGPQDRDEAIAGHKPFWIIADYLTQHGIAVLRYDDRGFAGSEGDYMTSDISDFANDARAGLGFLRSHPRIASDAVGLIGHSEGGAVAWLLAADRLPDFIITLAAPGVPGTTLMSLQRAAILRASGAPEDFITSYNELVGQATEIVLTTSDKTELKEKLAPLTVGTPLADATETLIAQLSAPAMLSFLRFDPAVYYPRIICPVLALNGEKDLQVPSTENLAAIQEGLSSNSRVTVRSYPGLNHLFQVAQSGLPTEYGEIEETFHAAVMKEITDWILEITARK